MTDGLLHYRPTDLDEENIDKTAYKDPDENSSETSPKGKKKDGEKVEYIDTAKVEVKTTETSNATKNILTDAADVLEGQNRQQRRHDYIPGQRRDKVGKKMLVHGRRACHPCGRV